MTHPFNTKRRRKITPLQEWRAQYHFIVKTIRALKGTQNGHVWGSFKTPRRQSIHAAMRVAAEQHMEDRKHAANLTRAQWEARDAIYKASVAAPAKTEY